MNIQILDLIEGARRAEGLTVIIDVFRAFSTACYVFYNGADRIIPVGDIQTARALKSDMPGSILIGERGGKIQPGFDYGNSPSQILPLDLKRKTVIHTTSAGTQGLANAKRARELITGSFVNAGAVIDYIRSRSPKQVSLVCMGNNAVEPCIEDTLCAEYIRDSLKGHHPDATLIIEKIKSSDSGLKFTDISQPWFPEADLNLCLNISRFNFILRAGATPDGLLELKPVYPPFV